MKKNIAKTLAVMLVLSSMIVFSPATMQVDVVSAATDTTPTTTAPTTTKAPVTNVIEDGSQVHVVVSGDMMWKIAQMHDLTLTQLLTLNPQITIP
ncbi:MAG TPA: LysM peptidoglycan-binding domain-containing protein, partial [Methanosarcinales archaeon]|nr:LysM peptidoglycan-binding domain-containing protein [Methanosarcinales archaeon]